jgi:TPR repeat protein
MKAWRSIRGLGLGGLAAAAALSGQAFADYENALETYKSARLSEVRANQVVGAIDLWQKSALAGDVRSARILGDLYSHRDLVPGNEDMLPEETGVVPNDSVKALAWYIIAATHDFGAYQQKEPLPAEINARIIAQRRIPEVKIGMTDAQVEAAETRVEQLLGGGTGFDLLRIAKMRAQGVGLTKNNTEALKYLYLARGRGRGANLDANTLIENLETLMVRDAVATAKTRADAWQPPLPETYAVLTKNERDNAQRLTALQYQELRENLDELNRQFEGNDVVVDKALQALGFYYDDDNDGKLEKAERFAAVKRFQTSLFIDRRGGQELSDEEKAMAKDIATGTLTDLQTVDLMARAAERGHAPSQHIYGVMLGRGIGVRKDGIDAIETLKKAADQNYALAHYSAGIFYVEGITAERSLRPSVREACFHLRSAAVLGYKPAEKAQKTYCKFD